MSFSEPFLVELAKNKQLTDRETEVFLALFSEGKTRVDISGTLYLQPSAISTYLTGVYKKFGIVGSGPVKESRLKDELKKREEVWLKHQANTGNSLSTNPSFGEDVLQEIQEHCRQKILAQYSRMRLLNGNEVGVDRLYVDVWLLNRSPRTFQVSPSKLLETFDLRNDRLGLGDRIKRSRGFEIADREQKLVILGKPGSGKTTFIKHLAVDWSKGKFRSEVITVLLEFRRIKDDRWNLMHSIETELKLENWNQIQDINQKISKLKQKSELDQDKAKEIRKEIYELDRKLESLPLQFLLKQGLLLVLMDGFDEVPTNELRRKVQNQIANLALQYPDNRLILTCRTQVLGNIPTGFTSVEVADFVTT